MKYEMDVEKISGILEADERPRAWLARKIGISPALLNYAMVNRTLDHVADIEDALGLEQKSLIREV